MAVGPSWVMKENAKKAGISKVAAVQEHEEHKHKTLDEHMAVGHSCVLKENAMAVGHSCVLKENAKSIGISN